MRYRFSALQTRWMQGRAGLSGFGFALFAGRGWAGVFALCLGVAVDEFDDRHCGVVAIAIAGLDDASVAAAAVGVALRQDRHQLFGESRILQRGDSAAAIRE